MSQTFYKNSNPIIPVFVGVRKKNPQVFGSRIIDIGVLANGLDSRKTCEKGVKLMDQVLSSKGFFIFIFTVKLNNVFPKELIKIIFNYITTKY